MKTPLTANGFPIDIKQGLWFEVGIDNGIETETQFRDSDFDKAFELFNSLNIKKGEKKFIDMWGIPEGDDVCYPIDNIPYIVEEIN
jgi:hypothetical protein